jgi:hypothetical protein
MRTAVALRGRGLVFVAFDLMFLDGKDLRALPIQERRAELRRLIPRSPKSRLQFSEAIAGSGPEVTARARRRAGSPAGSGPSLPRLGSAACWSISTDKLEDETCPKSAGPRER